MKTPAGEQARGYSGLMVSAPIHFDDAWLAGKRVVVMGLGRFGGGIGVTRFLAARGARVLVTDLDGEARLSDSLASIADLVQAGEVTLRLSGHEHADFASADLIVANPAVPRPWDNAYLSAGLAAGVPITTEIALLTSRLPDRSRVVGITGTAGKSTTSAMTAMILAEAFGSQRVHFGGNIGGSLLDRVQTIRADDWVVLELSSAQLYWLNTDAGFAGQRGWSPGVGVLTNLAPNHLDWHRGMDDYAAAKRVLFAFQEASDGAVLPSAGDAAFWLKGGLGRVAGVDRWLAEEGERLSLLLPGEHNKRNAAAAMASANLLAGVDAERARHWLCGFGGLPHRLQAVALGEAAQKRGIRAFNDSKCTTPEGAALAIEAFAASGECGTDRVVLIAGGADKGVDLSPMAEAAARCAAAFTIGKTGEALAGLIERAGGSGKAVGTLEEAVREAVWAVGDGGVVLLSPGCASWDQFVNYQARGDAFAQLVREALG